MRLRYVLAVENASYYFHLRTLHIKEEEFIRIMNESGGLLHLDFINIFVNSESFGSVGHLDIVIARYCISSPAENMPTATSKALQLGTALQRGR